MSEKSKQISSDQEIIPENIPENIPEIIIESLPIEQNPLGPLETISLTFEQRSRPRRKCITASGRKVALALPRGTILTNGMLVYNAAELSIQIEADVEDVLVVKPADPLQMCVVAHHLGNWHRSLQLDDNGCFVLEYDSPLLKWLDHHQITYRQERRSYHPNLKGAAHD